MAVSAAAATMPMWLEITFGVFQSVGAFGAVIAVAVAIYAIRRSEREFDEIRQGDRVAKAFQIFEELGSETFRKQVELADETLLIFSSMRQAGTADEASLVEYAETIHPVLNKLEKMCLEINHNIADQEIARKYFGKTLRNYWRKYAGYVIWYRKTVGNNTAYCATEIVPQKLTASNAD